MARQQTITVLRTTRAALDTQAGSSGLLASELYYITDDKCLAVGVTTSTYMDVVSGFILKGIDHEAQGIKYHGLAGETVAIGELMYAKLSTNARWFLTDADAIATSIGPLAIALNAATAGNAVSILLNGVMRDDSWSWTVGAQLYIGLTPGTFTETAPSATADIVRPIGIALDADTILFTPGMGWVEIS